MNKVHMLSSSLTMIKFLTSLTSSSLTLLVRSSSSNVSSLSSSCVKITELCKINCFVEEQIFIYVRNSSDAGARSCRWCWRHVQASDYF